MDAHDDPDLDDMVDMVVLRHDTMNHTHMHSTWVKTLLQVAVMQVLLAYLQVWPACVNMLWSMVKRWCC